MFPFVFTFNPYLTDIEQSHLVFVAKKRVCHPIAMCPHTNMNTHTHPGVSVFRAFTGCVPECDV